MWPVMKAGGVLFAALAVALSAATVIAVPTVRAQDASETTLIEATGIEGVSLGSSFDDVEAALGSQLTLSDERIVFAGGVFGGQLGRAIEHDGDVIAWVASTSGSDQIDLVALLDPAFRTAAGIGPGSTVREARSAYGAVRSVAITPGRTPETIDFANGPASLTFLTSLTGEDLVGRYADGRTSSFAPDPDGVIVAVWVGCDTADCFPLLGGLDTADAPVDTAPPTALATTGVETRWVALATLFVGGGCLTLAVSRRTTPAC